MINYLYKFQIGATLFTLTSAEDPFVFSGDTYEPAVISHDSLKLQTAFIKSQISVNIQLNHPLAVLLRESPGYEATSFFLYKVQDGVSSILWKGTIVGRSFVSSTALKLKIGTVLSSFGKGESRRFSSRSCNHVLYSAQCGAAKTATNGTLVAINNGAPLVLVSVPDTNTASLYSGGTFEIDSHSRYITNCVNAGPDGRDPSRDVYIVYLDNKIPLYLDDPIYVDTAVKIYKGCDKSIATCNSRFSNKDNFGGQPSLPLTNPFATTQYL